MTKDEAVAVAIEAKKKWGGGSSEFWLVNALESLGLIEFDAPQRTLWELLREHGVPLDKAQAICNDAMLRGVSVPVSEVKDSGK